MSLDPRAIAAFEAGARLQAAGDAAGAEASFRAALAAAPALAEAQVNLALLLEARGAVDEAEAWLQRAIAIAPTRTQAHLNLGALLAAQQRYPEAEAAYLRAAALDDGAPAVWSNLGALQARMGNDAKAEWCCRTALALDPAHPKARLNLSLLLLKHGRFEEGWALFESRDWYAPLARALQMPRWQGEPLAGRAVLIGHEAGHGDMIQFCRYGALLKARGAGRVGLLCHPALARLFATLDGVDAVLPVDRPLAGDWDLWTPALSLPHHCATRLDTVPAAVPYLRPQPALVARWAPRLPPRDGRLRVGLVWKGSAAFDNDAARSLPGLATLRPLWSVPGVTFVALQKGAGEDEATAPPPGLALTELGSGFADFADAAAALDPLDLLVSVDTAMAHLAGALDRPCWLLLPQHRTDWRWMADRDDSPWYPSLRLFRQRDGSGWAPVIADVAAALQRLRAARA